MSLTGKRTFVGFGFGAIQAGLFLYEAFRSGGFARLMVGEVAADAVEALRRSGGSYDVNVAHADRVELARVGPVQVENPGDPADVAKLIDAVTEAQEISTAVPSVQFYTGPQPGSIHRILAQGLRKKVATGGPRAVIYAAENHNHAAEILQRAVLEEIPAEESPAIGERVCFVNTVIGKMSGVISDAAEIQSRNLATVTPGSPRAFLVEEFNHILISRVHFPAAKEAAGFHRGIAAFVEKDDLFPFEEAKLYGHNATHALAAYLCGLRGLRTIADLRQSPDLLDLVRDAFLEESGVALIRKYSGQDLLFTRAGYREYVDDLIARMTNPFLNDTVERVGRDPRRKLGWDDRLVGTMRLAIHQGIAPHRYALGAAAALATLNPASLKSDDSVLSLLAPIWGSGPAESSEGQQILGLIVEARSRLNQWLDSGFQGL